MTDVYFVQNIDNSRLIPVRDPRREREQCVLAVCIALLFFCVLGYAWQSFQIVRLGYETEQLRAKANGLQQWNRSLRLEQASLRDPIRIYSLAEQDLGMSTAAPGQVIRMDEPMPSDSGAPVLAEASQSLPVASPGSLWSQSRGQAGQ